MIDLFMVKKEVFEWIIKVEHLNGKIYILLFYIFLVGTIRNHIFGIFIILGVVQNV
jgi:hypothetical protein